MSEADKLSAIYKGIQEMKIELARFIVHQEQARKEIDKLNQEVESLKGNQNKAFGVLTIAGIIGTAFFSWLFENFKK